MRGGGVAGGIWFAASSLGLLLLAGCGTSGPGGYAAGHSHAAHPMYKVGAPYEIGGVWYYPAVDYNYDETGIASWYGEQFDQKYTANGEIFDLNELTAAHRTLPMPSIVEVANLDNGRALRVRVNDRGPFARGRILDVSRRAAQLLGFDMNGTARVRVRILKEDSIRVAELAKRNGGDSRVLVAEAPSVASVAAAAAISRPTPPASLQTAPSYGPVSASAGPMRPLSSAPQPSASAALAPFPPAPPAAPITAVHAPVVVPELPPLPEKVKMVPVKSSGRIFIQAGAFSLAENAQRVRSRIAGLGSAQVLPASIKGASIYRVRLGPVPTVEQADQLLIRVIGSGYPEARIVVD
ncbi:MAG: septal ring lytic transglycosylase RlpA family protein [Alphaproteobacteria bacterium]|nr:septal ring lytic transglycosylase RlpA family protein [Alphaproteobacteria bacterium]